MFPEEGTVAGKHLQVRGVDIEVVIRGEHGAGGRVAVRW